MIHDNSEARSLIDSRSIDTDWRKSFSLQPGERRGWWSEGQAAAGKAGIALVHGAVCDHRTRILLDSGATTSILSLRLANQLGLKMTFTDQLKVKGLGDVVSYITAKAHVKITLGMSVVYFMDIWCGNIGEGTDCLLGMDFMIAAGVRLSAGEGAVRLPDEEKVPLLAPGQRPRLPTQVAVHNDQEIYLGAGQATVIPTSVWDNHPGLEVWLCRGDRWLTSLTRHGVRLANITEGSIRIPPRTPVAYLIEPGHLPDETRCVRPSSLKYREWQLEIYNALRSPAFERRRQAEIETYNASLPDPVERPEYQTPTQILRRPDGSGVDTPCEEEALEGPEPIEEHVLAATGADITPTVKLPMTVKLAKASDTPEPSLASKVEAVEELGRCLRVVMDDCRRAVDQFAEGEVRLHEGVDHIQLDILRDQLAVLPEMTSSPDPVDLDTADIGEEENTSAEIAQIRAILDKHRSAFISSGNALPPPARGVVCDIEVEPGTKPIAQRPRRIPAHQLEQVAELLKKLLETGIIEYSHSKWASPIVIVMKKNGKDIRLCIDYRCVNQLINLMAYPLPLIDELLDNFGEIMWFLSLDMASGFWAILMTNRAKEISAFICPLGHFQWVRMPFGLKNAPLIYQQVIDNCLWGFVRLPAELEADVEPAVMAGVGLPAIAKSVEPASRDVPVTKTVFQLNIPAPACMGPVLGRSSYIDDIAYGSPTWTQLCEVLDKLMYRLRYWNISVSLPKSAFGKSAIDYLSHEINRRGIKAQPKILKGIEKLQFPTSLKGVQSFLGSLNYYHKFIEGFPAIATVLYELTDEQIVAGRGLDRAKLAFEMLKTKVQRLPELRHGDRNKPFTIILHANPWAIGAVLAQEHDGRLWPVKFIGRTLQDAELRYHESEKEILALLRVLNSCYTLIVGQPLTIYTRHSVLKWLMTSKSLTERLMKWATFLSPWTFEVRRVDKDEDGLAALFTAGITPREHLDEAVSQLVPDKLARSAPIASLEMLDPGFDGYVMSFDGAAKLKGDRVGSASFVLWKLPGWDVIHAQGVHLAGVTVNEAEYYGLLSGLQHCQVKTDPAISDIVVVGDSRIVIQQCQGSIRCNQPNLQLLQMQFEKLKEKFNSVRLVHVKREFNAAADYMSTKALRAGEDQGCDTDLEAEQLRTLNLLASKIVKSAGEAGEAQVLTARTRSSQTTEVGQAVQERWNRIRHHQDLDPVLRLVRQFLKRNLTDIAQSEVARIAKLAEVYVLDHDDILRYVGGRLRETGMPAARLAVPSTLRADILHQHHEDIQGGHQGVTRTFERLRAEYYWPGMYRDVEIHVQECVDCVTSKGAPAGSGPSPGNVMPDYPFHILSMDFVIPLPASRQGNTALLLFQDMFSGFIMCKAMRGTTAVEVAEAYEEVVFRRFGASSMIRHDRDPRFMSEVFAHFSMMMGSQQRATLAYRPQANGQQERSVQTVMRSIKAYVEDPAQEDWEELAGRLMFALNTAFDSTRRQTPFFLVHGWDARTTMSAMLAPVPTGGRSRLQAYAWRIKNQRQYQYATEWARELQRKAQQKRADRQNEAWEDLADKYKSGFEVGDSVWLYLARVRPGLVKKLAHLWHGPFRIVEKKDGEDFRVRIKTDGTPYRLFPWVHVSRLKPRLLHPDRPGAAPVGVPDELDLDEALLPEDSWIPTSEHHEVEALLDVKWTRPRSGKVKKEYLVKWTGHETPTWEPMHKLHCGRLLFEFDRGARSRARFAAMQADDGKEDA